MQCEVRGSFDNGKLTVYLSGEISSANAPEVQGKLAQLRTEHPVDSVILDCDRLRTTSSAGLRVFLRLNQEVDNTKIINAHPDLYDVLDMTGFTDMMEVEKAYRVFSVEGCEVIGQGANGIVYRINGDTIVKCYRNPDALPEIKRERELARTAFVAGVPTAIPYDVVRIEGGGYGSVFELLNAKSFAKLLISHEKTVEEVADMSVELLKLIHSKTVKPGALPDMKQIAMEWVNSLENHLPQEQYEKLVTLVDNVPQDMHMLHGDYHIKNIELQDGEALLIDMDTLCHGHPVFELASMYNAYAGYGAADHSKIEKFLGISYETAGAFWKRSLKGYLGTEDPERIRTVEDKAKILGYTRILRREIRRNGEESEDGRELIDICRKELGELLPRVDTLSFF